MITPSLYSDLLEKSQTHRPIRVGLIGAGRFGTLFLAQARTIPGLHVMGIADLIPERIRLALERARWSPAQMGAATPKEAFNQGTTWATGNAAELIAAPGIDVIIEATGIPAVGVELAGLAIEAGRHVVMVNVEADVVAGPILAARAREAGVVYSMAYGDQPALICELVEWARLCGFSVTCAGKGTRYHPSFHQSTPEESLRHHGYDPETALKAGMNPKMFNSFIDGTKAAIEMAAVCNAMGLQPQAEGLHFPTCRPDELPLVCRPSQAGGILTASSTVEVISSLDADGAEIPHHLQQGVFVVFESDTPYVHDALRAYRVATDETGRYAALYRPFHLVGLELSISVIRAALRGEATGAPDGFRADVVATAKTTLGPNTILDGEGGATVYGTLVPAIKSVAEGYLPIGLCDGAQLKHEIVAGQPLRWSDVNLKREGIAFELRQEMEGLLQ